MTRQTEQNLQGPQALIGILQEGRVQKGRRHELPCILRTLLKGVRHHVKPSGLERIPYPIIEFLEALQRRRLGLYNRINRVQVLEGPIGLKEALDDCASQETCLDKLKNIEFTNSILKVDVVNEALKTIKISILELSCKISIWTYIRTRNKINSLKNKIISNNENKLLDTLAEKIKSILIKHIYKHSIRRWLNFALTSR
jgi:hypothetical protein